MNKCIRNSRFKAKINKMGGGVLSKIIKTNKLFIDSYNG